MHLSFRRRGNESGGKSPCVILEILPSGWRQVGDVRNCVIISSKWAWQTQMFAGHVQQIQRQSAVMSRWDDVPVPPCLRPSRLPSCQHGCACGLPQNKILLKSRFQLWWWGLECTRSALDLLNYKVLPLLSTHSGSHGCDFDRVFTKFYKWADNMWTPGIFPEAYFQSKRSDMNGIEKLPLCWSEPISICGRF